MTRAPALPLLFAGTVFGIACSNPTTTVPLQLNLDRPIDIAFACYGDMRMGNGMTVDKTQPLVTTAQPVAACAALSPPLASDLGSITLAPGQDNPDDPSAPFPVRPTWYAFILQSATGTVALATWKATDAEDTVPTNDNLPVKVVDADPLTPGINAISIGEDPIAIVTDASGCYEVTANAGSCDLSELKINTALDNLTTGGGTPTPVDIKRANVANATQIAAKTGALRSRPAAMVVQPGIRGVGTACPGTPTGRAYIAYPGCHLVAGVDLATGQVVSGIRYDSAGMPTILSGTELDNLTCPDECTHTGTPGTPGVRPVALDLRTHELRANDNPARIVHPTRLAIGLDIAAAPNAAPITVVDLDAAADLVSPPLSVTLEGKVSVTALALSPQIGMGGNAGAGGGGVPADESMTSGGQGQYVYAVTSDGTVRVADVLSLRRECDTQIDGRFLIGAPIPELQCLPSGDPARPRRAGVRGPGIELPNGAVPSSVAIVRSRNVIPTTLVNNVATPVAPAPGVWLGYFAIITSAIGTSYVVNVDDDYAPDQPLVNQPATAPVLVMPHQLRDGFAQRDARPEANTTINNVATKVASCTAADPLIGGQGGGPRTSAPAQGVPSNTISADKLPGLPTIMNVKCTDGLEQADHTFKVFSVSELDFAAPLEIRSQVYPDLKSISTEAWNLSWEGILSLDGPTHAIDGPAVRSGTITVDSFGMHLADPAHPFCDMGAETFDIAELRGCDPSNGDGDCPRGYTCYVHPNYVNPPNGPSVGACMLRSEASRLADTCRDFLTTRRRYTVGRVAGGSMVLLERKHELAMSPFDGCDDSNNDHQCNALAEVATRIGASYDAFNARTHWACMADPLRAPISADPAKNKRCVQVCSTDPSDAAYPYDCAIGTVCRALNPADPNDHHGVCLEGVEPPQACLNGPQRYAVRASEAFTVIGGLSGYVHPWVEGTDGTCTRPADDPAGPGPVQIGRIPLRVPACTLPASDVQGRLAGGGFDPNPCALTVSQFDNIAPTPVACSAVPATRGADVNNNLIYDLRDVPAIKFRNRAMTLTMVDPYRTCLIPPATAPSEPPSVPVNVPFAITDYRLDFVQKGGYTAPIGALGTYSLGLLATTSLVKVVRGPTDSIWVIDDGDFLSTQASSRGRVYRVESISPSDQANVLPQ